MIGEIVKRKSSRVFESDYEIDYEVIKDIISAASKAPSQKNRQPWRYYVIKGPQKRNLLNIFWTLSKIRKKRRNTHK